jgi:hypothetical protein
MRMLFTLALLATVWTVTIVIAPAGDLIGQSEQT